MRKAILYALAAVADIVIAVIAWRSGRVIIPLLLALAAICFVIAAVGHAFGFSRQSNRQ